MAKPIRTKKRREATIERFVREAVAIYGTAAGREALRGDRQNDPH